jgi:ABC-type nitrate/sulfonate/bicarbonate transport system permease component
MNTSENQHLFSSIGVEQQFTASIDLFYIGTFIGLAGGILCACVIVYFKYKKRKMELVSPRIEVSI